MSKNNMKLIMEGWRQSIKEMNAASASAVQGHAGQDEQLKEDNYEDSGEPWDPKSSSYPFQHPQKGLSAARNMKGLQKWVEKWKPSEKHPQLTKAVRVAPKGEPGNATKRMASIMKKGMREEEQVEEGFVKNAIIALGLMLPNLASGMQLDLGGGQKVEVSQVAKQLKADGSEASVEAAESVLKALKSDTNKDGVVDVTGGEYNMDSVDIQHIKDLLSKPSQADDGGKTMQQRVRDANKGALDFIKEGGI